MLSGGEHNSEQILNFGSWRWLAAAKGIA